VISIIIPTRNRAVLAARALAGVQSQTYADYEVILIDDGSDARTREAYTAIWASLDARFRLVLQGNAGQAGMGPSKTRNHGIALSQGAVLAFCDDDDFWCDPEHLQRVAARFEDTPTLDLHIADQRAVTVDGMTQPCWLPQLVQVLAGSARRSDGAMAVSPAELCRGGGFGHLNMLAVRKALVEQVGGFWELVPYEEDRDFFWRVVDTARLILFDPRVVAQHNVPDPQARANASTLHSRAERLLLGVLVCQHLVAVVRQPEVCALAGRYGGDLLRKLALLQRDAGQGLAALQFARQALAMRFSLKWALYVLTLWLRSFWQGRSA
jgi:glycosyltransferase involved in cell wall biosynthesis